MKKNLNKTPNRKTGYRMDRYKKKMRLKLWVWLVIITINIIIVLIALYQINNWDKDNKSTNKQLDEIKEKVKIEETNSNEELVNIQDDKDNDYWNYIKLPLVSVDFKELLEKNSDTVAFLKVNGTNINYPVVQTNDNEYYLHHSYNKTKNEAGWVFLDYRNNLDNLQENSIIYAHGRYDTTMFGSLKNVFKSDWYNKTDNYVVYLSTPNKNMLWQIFSVYKIKTETYYLTSSFASDESYQKFIDTIKERSKYNFNTNVTTNDKILTLSTCYNNSEKVVLHAKLIKIQNR